MRAGSEVLRRRVATSMSLKKEFPLRRKAVLLTEHAILEGGETSGHPAGRTGQPNQPGP